MKKSPKKDKIYILEDNVLHLFKGIGLNDEEAEILKYLLNNGSSTILEISRAVKLKRTNIYRICENLAVKGFIIKLSEYKTTKYEICSLEFLQSKIDDIQINSTNIVKLFREVKEEIQTYSQKKNQIKVIHYSGPQGIKQLLWNVLSAKDGVYGFGYRTLREITGNTFFDKWWDEIVRRKIKNYVILNSQTSQMKNKYSTAENIYKIHKVKAEEIWEEKIISKKVLEVTEESFIYNDIFAVIQWEKDEVFGVEIYNKKVADQEKSIFDVLWKIK